MERYGVQTCPSVSTHAPPHIAPDQGICGKEQEKGTPRFGLLIRGSGVRIPPGAHPLTCVNA